MTRNNLKYNKKVKRDGRTDRPTDRRMDGPTDGQNAKKLVSQDVRYVAKSFISSFCFKEIKNKSTHKSGQNHNLQ